MHVVNLETGTGVEVAGGLEMAPPLTREHIESIRRAHGIAQRDEHYLQGGPPMRPRDLDLHDLLVRDRIEQACPGRLRYPPRNRRQERG